MNTASANDTNLVPSEGKPVTGSAGASTQQATSITAKDGVPPGDDYEEIREQVRSIASFRTLFSFEDLSLNISQTLKSITIS